MTVSTASSRRRRSASSSTSTTVAAAATGFVAHTLVAVLLSSSPCQSFSFRPSPGIATTATRTATNAAAASAINTFGRRSQVSMFSRPGAGDCGGDVVESFHGGVQGRKRAGLGMGGRLAAAAQRQESCLKAYSSDSEGGNDQPLKGARNAASALSEDDKALQEGTLDHAKMLMYGLDPDDELQGPMYYGSTGNDGPTVYGTRRRTEIRHKHHFLAFCIDRNETPDEPKNFPFWGVRLEHQLEHIKWARIRGRTFESKPLESAIAWERSILSPSKLKVMGSMVCIGADTKEGAIRLLEDDPFRKAGLYGTVSLYRYPYSEDSAFNWQNLPHPYVALCMDKKGTAEIRKKTRPAHLDYYFRTRRCSGAGPIFDAFLEEDDPENTPIGSLLFFNAAHDDEARSTAENDPYNEAGVFDSIFVARFNDIDLDGTDSLVPHKFDPMRTEMEKVGLAEEYEYPKEYSWKPFGSLSWLDTEVTKKKKQDLVKYRRSLYQERDRRLGRNKSHRVDMKNGAYVYVGSRENDEWYDHWPLKHQKGANRLPRLDKFNARVPPANIFEDDLN